MRLLSMTTALALAAALLAGGGARADDMKIGVVDLEQALSSTAEGREAREELERKQREAQESVRPLIERYEGLQEEIKGKKFVLSEEVLYQKQLDLLELRNEIESQMKELEGRLKVDQERVVGPLRKRLVGIVKTIGREQGFSIIVERGTPGLLYSREALDVTEQVIESFDQKG